ncbi:MAG: fructose-bisphosphate aldolase class I [Pseudomonadota bacterium]|nr:fructose-bisphosphate aldolase class I [Pseudomonadota bacterium]
MNRQGLITCASSLVASGKGLLAMDESNPTCNRRFAALGIPQTVEMRRKWRELLVTAPGLGDSISGAILYDETIRQSDHRGRRLIDRLIDAGIIPGIKVDIGAKPLALHVGEKVTEGLDGLRDRLAEYAGMGARFAKWRAVIGLDGDHPSIACIRANMQALARYAGLCQEAGVVPMVEPEVLMTGSHPLERSRSVTGDVLTVLFEELHVQGVLLEGVILKPNMVLPGLDCPIQAPVEMVAAATIDCLLKAVPRTVAGVAFLSGGQSAELATARLNAMNAVVLRDAAPWPVVFSFARAIQQPALDIWRGNAANVTAAQQALLHRARCNHAALSGAYDAAMELGDGCHKAS